MRADGVRQTDIVCEQLGRDLAERVQAFKELAFFVRQWENQRQ